jgi:hypothetical protein
MIALLMAGNRPPDNAAPAASPESTDKTNVHHLFSVRNMFFLGVGKARIDQWCLI